MVFSFNKTIFFVGTSHNTLEEWQVIFSRSKIFTNSYLNSVHYFKYKPKAKSNISEGVSVNYYTPVNL